MRETTPIGSKVVKLLTGSVTNSAGLWAAPPETAKIFETIRRGRDINKGRLLERFADIDRFRSPAPWRYCVSGRRFSSNKCPARQHSCRAKSLHQISDARQKLPLTSSGRNISDTGKDLTRGGIDQVKIFRRMNPSNPAGLINRSNCLSCVSNYNHRVIILSPYYFLDPI